MDIDIENFCMKVTFRSQLLVLFAVCALAITPTIVNADFDPKTLCPNPEFAVTGNLSTGSAANGSEGPEYLICTPSPASPPPALAPCAVLFAHGSVDAVAVDNGEIKSVEGGKLANIAGQLNEGVIQLAAPCAFAVVSRQETGAFIKKEGGQLLAIQELRELKKITKNRMAQTLGIPKDEIDVFGTGISLGGLLMTLAQERTNLFDGAIPACGPYILKNQVEYQHDAIVVFDYLNFITTRLFDQNADVPTIPEEVIKAWDDDAGSNLEFKIRSALKQQWNAKTKEFLRVLRLERSLEKATGEKLADFNEDQQDIVVREIKNLFEDAVFNLKDFQQKLCRKKSGDCKTTGNVYANRLRIYSGSADDVSLNRGVQRFALRAVDQHAVKKFSDRYSVSGKLGSFTISLHGEGETRVPFKRNATQYWVKALFGGSARNYRLVPADEIDHCQFEPAVAFLALLNLRLRAAASP